MTQLFNVISGRFLSLPGLPDIPLKGCSAPKRGIT